MSSKIDMRGRETGHDKRGSSVRQREERVGPKTNAGRVSVKYFE